MKNNLRISSSLLAASVWFAAFAVQAGFVIPVVPEVENKIAPALPGLLGPQTWWVTNNLDSGPGTLRDNIAAAAAGDRIRFALPHPTIIILSNQLTVAKDLQILGPGPRAVTVMRDPDTNAPSFRLFNVQTGAVTIAGLTLRNGRALNATGAADNLGGAILNRGDLTVSNCVVTANTAPTEFGGTGFGGGIFSLGSLHVIDSTVSDNQATAAGGGIATFHSPVFTLETSTVSSNSAAIQGGGVNFQGVNGTIRNSTISGNFSPADGIAAALLTICFGNEGANLSVSACTIAGNTGNTNGAFVLAALDGNLGLTNRLANNIVADNQAPNFSTTGNPVLDSIGHNLDSDGSSGFLNGTNGDLIGATNALIDAKLFPLDRNGDHILTHNLRVGSPALAHGSALDADGSPLLTDEREFARPTNSVSDIGALENQPPVVTCPGAEHHESPCRHGAVVSLAASVFDPDGDALSVVWSVDGNAVRTNYVDASHPPRSKRLVVSLTLTKGSHEIMVTASDGKASLQSCSTRIRVGDHRPPHIIAVTASPRVLSPVDGQLKPVHVTVFATDDGGPVHSHIVSVTSNQPQGASPDWNITGDLTVDLRAELSSPTARRVYTITVAATDASGNTSNGTVRVSVLPSQHKEKTKHPHEP